VLASGGRIAIIRRTTVVIVAALDDRIGIGDALVVHTLLDAVTDVRVCTRVVLFAFAGAVVVVCARAVGGIAWVVCARVVIVAIHRCGRIIHALLVHTLFGAVAQVVVGTRGLLVAFAGAVVVVGTGPVDGIARVVGALVLVVAIYERALFDDTREVYTVEESVAQVVVCAGSVLGAFTEVGGHKIAFPGLGATVVCCAIHPVVADSRRATADPLGAGIVEGA
jgi:hypothetical protein